MCVKFQFCVIFISFLIKDNFGKYQSHTRQATKMSLIMACIMAEFSRSTLYNLQYITNKFRKNVWFWSFISFFLFDLILVHLILLIIYIGSLEIKQRLNELYSNHSFALNQSCVWWILNWKYGNRVSVINWNNGSVNFKFKAFIIC